MGTRPVEMATCSSYFHGKEPPRLNNDGLFGLSKLGELKVSR